MSRYPFFIKLESGARLPEALAERTASLGIGLAYIVGIGGFEEARLAVYDVSRRVYHYVDVKPLKNHVLEVAALSGNIACFRGKCYPHIHVVLARKPGEVYAGHLLEATVKPLLEVFLHPVEAREADLERMFGHRTTPPQTELLRK